MRHTIKIRDLLKEQAEVRYGRNTSQPRFGMSDGRLTDFLRRKLSPIMTSVTKNCIAPSVPSVLGHKYKNITFESFCSLANVNLAQVKRDMVAIKKRRVNMVQIGYGGFGINSLHFMSKFAQLAGVYHPFEKLSIYENDEFTFLNAVRIYKDVSTIRTIDMTMNKLALFQEENNLSSHVELVEKYFKIEDTNRRKQKTVYVGAPDFDTRVAMEDKNFIFTGHSGNEVELYSRPIINQNLMTETYGVIDLPYFYVNLLKATEKLINYMAHIDEYPLDKSLYKFNAQLFEQQQNRSTF